MIKQCWSQNFLNPTKKQILVDNGTFILPVMWFSYSKIDKNWLFYIQGLPKTILEPKFRVSNSKNKDLLYNDTFILPDLVNMASLCSGVGSDLTAPFKLPGWKSFESLKKLLEKQRNGTQKPQQSSYLECNAISCHFMKFHSISAFDATFCNDFHQSMPFQCKHRQDDFNVCTRVFCSKTILYYWYTKVMVWLLVVWSAF